MSEGDIGFCSLSMGWRLHISERSRWEAWIGKQVITGTFWEFLRKDPLTFRTGRKEESNEFESIHEVSDFGNFIAASNNG